MPVVYIGRATLQCRVFLKWNEKSTAVGGALLLLQKLFQSVVFFRGDYRRVAGWDTNPGSSHFMNASVVASVAFLARTGNQAALYLKHVKNE
jgi:hypothetical protein